MCLNIDGFLNSVSVIAFCIHTVCGVHTEMPESGYVSAALQLAISTLYTHIILNHKYVLFVITKFRNMTVELQIGKILPWKMWMNISHLKLDAREASQIKFYTINTKDIDHRECLSKINEKYVCLSFFTYLLTLCQDSF